MELKRKDHKLKESSKILDGFSKEIEAYQKRHTEKRKQLEKMLIKSDKLIKYFHNAAEVLGKEMGKILHHLLLQLPYNMKEIPGRIVKDNMEKLYSLIRTFEGN